MSSKKSDGFEDWESDFFSEGEAGDLSWEEEEAKRLETEAAEKKVAEEAAAKAAAEAAAAKAAAEEAAAIAAAEEAAAKAAAEEAAAKAAAEEAVAKAAAAEAERVAAEEAQAAADAQRAEEEAAATAENQRLRAEREAETARQEEETRLAAEAARLAAQEDAALAEGGTEDLDLDPATGEQPRILMPVSEQPEVIEQIEEPAAAPSVVDVEDDPTEAAPGLDSLDGPPLQESSVDEALQTKTHTPYTPSEGEGGRWRDLVTMLEAEATGSGTPSPLLAEAARVCRTRLGDLDNAERLARAAVVADEKSITAWRELERALNRNQRFEELRVAMEALAGLESDDVAASEILQDAALLARRRLGQDEQAVRLLQESVKRNPKDFFSLQLLRDVQLVGGDWNGIVVTLNSMAGLSSGVQAARLQYERGRVFAEQLADAESAQGAFSAAQSADPSYGPAFVALERSLETTQGWAELAELYLGEAERLGGADGAFFATRAGRVFRSRLFEGDKAEQAYGMALTLGAGPAVRHELEALLAEQGRFDDLAASLRQAIASADPDAADSLRFRLATLLENQSGDLDGALELYREVAKEPAAVPAAEGVARILRRQGDFAALRAFWAERSELLDDANLKVTLAYRMGEIAEGPLNDQQGARENFEAVLDIAPGYLPALEGLERVYTRLADWERLAAVYEQRAILNEEPGAIALQLHRAGAVCELRMDDLSRAKGFYLRALEHQADFSPSLDAVVRVLEVEGDWTKLAQVLQAAGDASQEGSQQVSFYYRAGRILADKVRDHSAAIACVERCLELSPGFLGAHYLLKELKGHTEDLAGLYQLQVAEAQGESDLDRKAWQYLSASAMAEGLNEADPAWGARQVLESEPRHPGALAVLEEIYLRQGDSRALVTLYREAAAASEDEAERGRITVALADQLRESGDTIGTIQAVGEIVHSESEGRPLLALSRLCEGLNYWEEAHRAAAAAGNTYEAARLQEDYLETPAEALEGYRDVLEADPENLGAIFGTARLERKAGNREGLAKAHWRVAKASSDAPVRVVHSVLAGHLYEGLGDKAQALIAYQEAFEARPAAGKAFEGVRRLLLERGELDALVVHFDALDQGDPLGLAESLEEAGDAERAAAVLADASDLVSLSRRELSQEQADDWLGAFKTLSARAALLQAPEQQAAALAKQRWILAEKLAQTDEAWDFYRQLHEEHPNDPEVLEALARIAGARGELDLSLQYLGQLAGTLTSPEDAGRVQRRIAEAQASNGKYDEARSAYLAALDHNPQDQEALTGLRGVAEASEDWQAMVGVLAREASLQDGDGQVATYAEIARTWQDKLGEDAVAGDAWRKVLELEPNHREALERLLALAESSGAWSDYVTHAEQLADQMDGAERAALEGKAGKAWLQQLRNEDRALVLLERASAPEHVDLEAARLLEQLRGARGEWDGVVTALQRQAEGTEGSEAVEAWVRAARIQRDSLQDRSAAAESFAKAQALDPAHDESLRFLADHAYRGEDLDSAIGYFSELEKKSDDWDLDDFDEKVEVAQFYFQYATALLRLGRTEQGRGKLERALELNPSHLPSLRAIGPLWMEIKEWHKAQDVYRQILQLIGGSGNSASLSEAYTCLGEVELALGKTEKAKKRFNKALEIQENDVRALRGAAQVLFERQEWSTLLNHYNNIIYHAKKPGYVIEAYLTKGFVLDVHMNLADKAAQHYEKSLTFDPGQLQALLRLGELALRRGDWASAGSLAERGLAVEAEDSTTKAKLRLVKAVAAQASGDAALATQAYGAAQEDEAVMAAVEGLEISDHAEVTKRLHAMLQTL